MRDSQATVKLRNFSEIEALVGFRPAVRLQAIARSLHRLAEYSCNYGLSDRQERRYKRLEAEADAIAREHGLRAYNQSDPRGWPLYIYREEAIKERYPEADYAIDTVYNSVGTAVCPY